MGDLSPHFSLSEFATCRPGECTGTLVSPALVCRLEALRSICGNHPCRIVSGYRCYNCNRRVGGASHSEHMRGEAADLVYGYATLAQAERAGFMGIGTKGIYATHVDVRSYRARWSYPMA